MAAGRLEGKVSVVTGAARGFGQGIAAKFAKEGSKMVVVDVLEEAGQAVADELGGKFVKADFSSREDWERILAETLGAFGQFDIVVNNAGTTYENKPAEEVTEDEFDLVEAKRPGVFVQVASTGAIRLRVRLTWYNASKAAAVGATKALAVEYAPRRIRFNAVSPSVGTTPLSVSTAVSPRGLPCLTQLGGCWAARGQWRAGGSMESGDGE